MTIKDKFLKDGVSVEEFIEAYCKCSESSVNGIQVYLLKDFLNEEAQPTLTEDERVILRNIKNDYDTIERTSFGSLKIVKSNSGYTDFYEFNHLFQFIKERRRI